jgi:hypothetical protein
LELAVPESVRDSIIQEALSVRALPMAVITAQGVRMTLHVPTTTGTDQATLELTYGPRPLVALALTRQTVTLGGLTRPTPITSPDSPAITSLWCEAVAFGDSLVALTHRHPERTAPVRATPLDVAADFPARQTIHLAAMTRFSEVPMTGARVEWRMAGVGLYAQGLMTPSTPRDWREPVAPWSVADAEWVRMDPYRGVRVRWWQVSAGGLVAIHPSVHVSAGIARADNQAHRVYDDPQRALGSTRYRVPAPERRRQWSHEVGISWTPGPWLVTVGHGGTPQGVQVGVGFRMLAK